LGRPEDAVTIAKIHVVEDPISIHRRFDLGLALASVGDYIDARPILEVMWARSKGRVTDVDFSLFHAAALTAIRRDSGEDAEVGELLAAMRDNVRRYREAGITLTTVYVSADFEEGLTAFLSGEHEKGLTLIAKAAEDGYFILPNEAYLQELYDDPGFTPIRAGQEARQKRERDRFLTIVCNDNPYADVWQPEDGTCDKFTAAGGN
jgi:hypothetical protein